jgi:hypothetical protein
MYKIISIITVVGMALAGFPKAEALSSSDASAPRAGQSQRLSQATGRPSAGAVEAQPGRGTPATVVDDQEVDGILGKNVRGSAGEDMGRIIDILVNKSGVVRAAVIDFGGFLGVGSRKIAVDWGALRFPESGKLDRIILELTRNQVRLAPEYRQGEPIVVLGFSGTEAPEAPPPKPEK